MILMLKILRLTKLRKLQSNNHVQTEGRKKFPVSYTHLDVYKRQDIGRTVNIVIKNRLKSGKTHRLKEEGRDLTKMELQRYGKSEQLRYLAQSKEPIYPISYVQCTNPMNLRRKVCAYTATGRSAIHDDLRINTSLLLQLMRAPTYRQMCIRDRNNPTARQRLFSRFFEARCRTSLPTLSCLACLLYTSRCV